MRLPLCGASGDIRLRPALLEGAAAARERFGAEPRRFAAVLVGKDGVVKHRSGGPVKSVELYALIDAMPMRRRETRDRREREG